VAERRPRKRLVVVGIVVAVSGLGAAIWYDADAHVRAGAEASTLRTAEHHLAALRHDRAVTDYADAVKTNTRNNLQASIGTTLGQLAGVETSLSNANAGASLEGLGIAALHTCLGGVQDALFSIAGHNNMAAAKAISAVSGPCSSLDGGANAGLVYPFDFPDPDVTLFGQTYYAYATNSVAGNIQIISSTDLNHWAPVGNALPALPSWAKANETWAPSVTSRNGTYLMYYTAEFAPSGIQCISVATASSPQGPFTDNSVLPLECQQSLGGSIDPSAFTDADGVPYLVWKSGGPGSSKIWAQQLNASGTGFAAATTPTQLLAPDQLWEGGTVEAPDLVLVNGHYVLFFSGNDWNTGNYAVGVARCSGPVGPCTDASPNPILSSDSETAGPGGESFFVDAHGNFWLAFHAWVPGAVGYPNSRDLYLRRVNFSGPLPSVAASGTG
jgi:hypothetical protein